MGIVSVAPPPVSDASLPLLLPSVPKEEVPDNEREKSPEKEAAAGEDAEMVRGATDASLRPTSPTPNMEKVKQLTVTFDHRQHLTA